MSEPKDVSANVGTSLCETGAGLAMVAYRLGDDNAYVATFSCADVVNAVSKIIPNNDSENTYRISLLPPQTIIPDVPIFNLNNEPSGCL